MSRPLHHSIWKLRTRLCSLSEDPQTPCPLPAPSTPMIPPSPLIPVWPTPWTPILPPFPLIPMPPSPWPPAASWMGCRDQGRAESSIVPGCSRQFPVHHHRPCRTPWVRPPILAGALYIQGSSNNMLVVAGYSVLRWPAARHLLA